MGRKSLPKRIVKLVWERARGYCEYCLASAIFSSGTYPCDHVIPFSKGGTSELHNLVLSCGYCNGHKHDKTHHFDPMTLQVTRIFNPRQDKWQEHFEWNNDKTIILGITDIGRTTIDLLKINSENKIFSRWVLHQAGLHPPTDFP